MSEYKVTYERDESGWWFAAVRGVRGCHTQGRTIEEAKRRIREALALFVDDAKAAELIDDVKLPAEIRKAVGAYRRTRTRLESAQEASKTAAEQAIEKLARDFGLSVRDVGGILDLSHQRVQQIVEKMPANRRPRRKPALNGNRAVSGK